MREQDEIGRCTELALDLTNDNTTVMRVYIAYSMLLYVKYLTFRGHLTVFFLSGASAGDVTAASYSYVAALEAPLHSQRVQRMRGQRPQTAPASQS